MRRWGWFAAVFCAMALSLGCGGGRTISTGNLRLVAGVPDAPSVNILIDGSSVAGPLTYTNATGYLSVKPGSRHIEAVPLNSSSAIFDQTISITANGHQTFLVTGSAASTRPVLLTDGGTTSTSGFGNVRVVNAASSMGPADVYLVVAGSGIAQKTPTQASLAVDQSTGYQLAAIGDYQVFLTAPGTTNSYLTTGPLALNQGQNQTVVVLNGISGGFLYTVLTDP